MSKNFKTSKCRSQEINLRAEINIIENIKHQRKLINVRADFILFINYAIKINTISQTLEKLIKGEKNPTYYQGVKTTNPRNIK